MKIKCPIILDNLIKTRILDSNAWKKLKIIKIFLTFLSDDIAAPIRWYYYYYSLATFTNTMPVFWCRKWGEFGAVEFDLIYITLHFRCPYGINT